MTMLYNMQQETIKLEQELLSGKSVLLLTCNWCSLSDEYSVVPDEFKCPYCGNGTYRTVKIQR